MVGGLCLGFGVAVGAVTPELERAIQAYNSLDLKVAAGLLDQALLGAATDPERATVLMYTGLVQLNLRQRDDAATSFERALELDVDVELPDGTSPKIVAQFESLRRRVRESIAAQPNATAIEATPVTSERGPASLMMISSADGPPPARRWTWATAAVSAAAFAVGGSYRWLAYDKVQAFTDERWADRASTLKGDVESMNRIGTGAFVVSGVLAGAALGLYFFEPTM